MLSGQVVAKVSRKYQTALPIQYRKVVGEKIILTKSMDQCLLILAEKNWETLLEGTKGMPFTDKATREVQRYLFGNAVVVELDNQGRFVLPEYLREYAKVEQEVVFVGVQRYVELWDKAIWNEHQKSIAKSIDLMTVNLTKTSSHE